MTAVREDEKLSVLLAPYNRGWGRAFKQDAGAVVLALSCAGEPEIIKRIPISKALAVNSSQIMGKLCDGLDAPKAERRPGEVVELQIPDHIPLRAACRMVRAIGQGKPYDWACLGLRAQLPELLLAADYFAAPELTCALLVPLNADPVSDVTQQAVALTLSMMPHLRTKLPPFDLQNRTLADVKDPLVMQLILDDDRHPVTETHIFDLACNWSAGDPKLLTQLTPVVRLSGLSQNDCLKIGDKLSEYAAPIPDGLATWAGRALVMASCAEKQGRAPRRPLLPEVGTALNCRGQIWKLAGTKGHNVSLRRGCDLLTLPIDQFRRCYNWEANLLVNPR